MKTIITFILLGFTQICSAALTDMAFIEDLAKEKRRELWVSGYGDVHSSVSVMQKSDIDQYVENETQEHYETPLDSDEIADIYRCHYRQSCTVYHIGVSSEYYGGYGEEGYFILLENDRKFQEIGHVIYSE